MRTYPSSRPHVVLSSGDPSGIGSEIILKAIVDIPGFLKEADLTIVGNFMVYAKIARILGIEFLRERIAGNFINFVDLDNVDMKNFAFGKSKPSHGKAAVEYVMYAAAIVESEKNASLVTAPINKESVHDAGFSVSGHTELLKTITKSGSVTMMFTGGPLKLSLVTRHVPLEDITRYLTKDKIKKTAHDTYFALRKLFKIKNPIIAVAGLNPHAGEGGIFGKIEERIILPAVASLRKKIKNIKGPDPADTLFYKAYQGRIDAVVCMYHDQGLIPLKMVAFEKGVNLTIGLPFIRTSPDHGTAFDIAGKGRANPSSMIEAIKLAITLTKKQ
ncbi:MAG: 4-hydroxythreonine-4-phosphate dehydrogenase PdxA [Candidatus Omnitrophica bacterium]|nr:4-hydroxythreonine-4-phosphate dehydrogenase PdxA [Candidatus Omnitrophota bacterium]